MSKWEVMDADCLDAMDLVMDENSIDAIVTDPPYGLGFMGKQWDRGVPGVAFWTAALRVLKPGGYLLAFSGTRTYHRMVCAIEDAGFEIRDQIQWLYGSGFPKSLDVSKALDKAAGAEREITREAALPDHRDGSTDMDMRSSDERERRDNPATAAAAEWAGWGTALKPAHEPIVVARKPLIGTVAENVLRHGTGALNIDGCRIEAERATGWGGGGSALYDGGLSRGGGEARPAVGRWPANVIHDGSDEVLAAFPDAPGQLADARNDGEPQGNAVYGAMNYTRAAAAARGDSGSAARFFYCAKASKKDRDEGLADFVPTTTDGRQAPVDNPYLRGETTRRNSHPTVKPTALMRYLVRLVTPPGGVVLDPFTGSGSTGKAAVLEGFHFVGIEKESESVALARARIGAVAR